MPNTSDDFDGVRFVIIKQLQFTEGPADDVVLDVPWNRWEASALEDMSAAGYFFTREVNAVLCAVWQSLNGNGPEGRSTVRLKGM
jgi:hypothetical protein